MAADRPISGDVESNGRIVSMVPDGPSNRGRFSDPSGGSGSFGCPVTEARYHARDGPIV